MAKKLNVIWQPALIAQKDNHTLCCISRNMASRSRQVVFSLYYTLVGPYLEYCIELSNLKPFLGPQHRKGLNLIGPVQRRTTEFKRGLSSSSLCRQAEKIGAVQPREEKVLRRAWSSFLVSKGQQERHFYKGM